MVMPREGKLEIKTCEQYVLQRLEETEAKNAVLEQRINALTDRLSEYQSSFMSYVITEGRAHAFSQSFSEFGIKDATSFANYCEKGLLTFSEVVEMLGKVGFIEEFKPELEALWKKYQERHNKDND